MWLIDWLMGKLRPTPVPTPIPPDEVPHDIVNDVNPALLAEHNRLRKEAGIGSLLLDGRLVLAARKHMAWMVANKTLNHEEKPGTDAFTGKWFMERIKATGYKIKEASENIASGQRSAKEACDSWMSSKGHRANMLNKNFNDVGFSAGIDANGMTYWCAVFGTE